MKRTFLFFSYLFLCLFCISCDNENVSVKKEVFDPQIFPCKWKGDASCFIKLSFDDTSPAHYDIAKLLDQFGIKGTFFLQSSLLKGKNPNNIIIAKYKEIISHGHEIGSHSIDHIDLTELDQTGITEQIVPCTELLGKTFGIKVVGFAAPFHASNELVKKNV